MRITLAIFLFALTLTTGTSQSIVTPFGKNRVQFHDDFDSWDKYETENFITYWYGKGRFVAEPAIQIAERYHDDIQNIMEHRMNDKINIIVYTDITDMKQSNIGLEETFTSETGTTKIEGNKMFIYFNGDHLDLKRQIREGIAGVYLRSMLFGENFQEVIQNAVLLDLPEWYKQGIISYAGREWDHLVDDELRDLLQQKKKYWKFRKLAEDHPRIAGHAFWFYLDQAYGKSSISNILYLTRITRRLENAFSYVTDNELKQLELEWASYFEKHYAFEEDLFASDEEHKIKLKNKRAVPVSTMKFNSEGNKMAYAFNRIGKYCVAIKDMETGKQKVIFRYGHKNALQATDFNYPILAWHPNGVDLSIIYEHRDVIYHRLVNTETKEKQEQSIPFELFRIYAAEYYDEENILFTANTEGFSDIYLYQPEGRNWQHVSNDFYDDKNAVVGTYQGKKGFYFASNRTNNHLFELTYDTIIPTGDFNLFFYDLEADDKSLIRLTKTPKINEDYPKILDENRITYLSEASGMVNVYVLETESKVSYPVTNKDRNTIRYAINPASGELVSTYYKDGGYNVYQQEVDWDEAMTVGETRFDNRNKKKELAAPSPMVSRPKEEIQEDFFFQSDFDDPETIEEITPINDKDSKLDVFSNIVISEDPNVQSEEVKEIEYSQIAAAQLAFRVDNFTTSFDNNILFEGLETYTGNSDELLNQPMGLLIKGTMKDLFEDYVIEAGARYPLSFNGSEYFVTFDNRKRLIDKRYALYRRSQMEVIDENSFPQVRGKKISTLALAQYRYPFDIYRSVRLTGQFRTDNFFLKSVDNPTFEAPFESEERIILRLEYIYDNTIEKALNIRHGTRYKFFTEIINEFNIDVVDGFEFDASRGFTTILGFDARHYIPFLKHSLIALRTAGASSFGSKKNLYYLGGVNNMLTNPFNNDIPIPTDAAFAYKTNIHHLRGFDSNIRNGSSYALANVELRLPFFKYIFGEYGGSAFLRNLQIVGFFDMGTAWHGASPFDDDNPLNSVTVETPGVLQVDIQYFRDPLVMGYGAGLRMSMLGYFLRFDLARGIETQIVQDTKFHFSIGLDF